MRLFTRLTVCAAAAMLLSSVLFHLADAWFGEDTSVLGAGRQLVLEARRTDALRARTEMVARSLAVKRDIIDQLLAGRLRFRQAIVQFHRANEMVENVDLDLIPPYRTPPAPQGVGRQVFIWVRNSVDSWPPEKAEPLLADLEREYQKLFDGAKPEDAPQVPPMEINSIGGAETNAVAG